MKTPTIIDEVLSAVNSGSTEIFLELFTEDGEVDDWGAIYKGKTEIRTWSDRELIGAKARLTLHRSEVMHQEFRMVVNITGAGFRGLILFALTLENSRIRRMTISCS